MKGIFVKKAAFALVIFTLAAVYSSPAQAAAGDLYVGALNKNKIYIFNTSGSQTAQSPFESTFFADTLAFDSKGNLFVSDGFANVIHKITPAGMATNFASNVASTGLAFDAAGNLFAADALTNSILKFTPSGARSTFVSGLNGARSLAFDRSGNLFVTQSGTSSIVKFTPGGTKSTFASGLNLPEGLAFDGAGNLYEADLGSGRVLKFAPNGSQSPFATSLSAPRSLAFDRNGNLFVGEFSVPDIVKFTPAGVKSPFASADAVGGLAFEPPTAQLTNISTRASVQTGQRVTIGGFIVTGTDSKQVVVRGLGPTLSQPPFNVTGVLADPFLSLRDGDGNVLWNNNDWKDSQQAAIQATSCNGFTCAPPNDLESAILRTLAPGNYTAILSGRNNTTGIGLVEVYDVATGAFAELTNVSTRGFVGTGQAMMIGGFITGGGNGSTQIVVRGLGPTLGRPPFNVTGVLADPFLSLRDGNGNVLWNNNDWKDSQQAQIQAASCNGFTCAPPDDLESAIVRTVAPGNYTAILSGRNNTTGIGLVEIYKVR